MSKFNRRWGITAWDGARGYCANLSLADGGPGAWRLPTVKELATIVDEGRYNPAIDPAAFPATPNDPLWSTSPFAKDASAAWVIEFENGYVTTVDKGYAFARVRCVH